MRRCFFPNIDYPKRLIYMAPMPSQNRCIFRFYTFIQFYTKGANYAGYLPVR